ncbi:hypothetical protein GUJ93_ZPchr0009g1069 [Zizania palustris]|uniref:Uncharacterized protein n=1 Tax=Zizania palustris TaxID=103762 RepID=A0A8J5RP08_ZIZPA|nr:hypothetical protein GUJ93_ZPchr0009g1069 [Zizania palustris]
MAFPGLRRLGVPRAASGRLPAAGVRLPLTRPGAYRAARAWPGGPRARAAGIPSRTRDRGTAGRPLALARPGRSRDLLAHARSRHGWESLALARPLA